MTYFILINNQQQGPYTLDELRSRNITSATLVWKEGMADWTPAWKVAELVSLFHADAADNAQTTPPPAPSAGATGAATAPYAAEQGTSAAQGASAAQGGAYSQQAGSGSSYAQQAAQDRYNTNQLYADAQDDETVDHGNGYEER